MSLPWQPLPLPGKPPMAPMAEFTPYPPVPEPAPPRALFSDDTEDVGVAPTQLLHAARATPSSFVGLRRLPRVSPYQFNRWGEFAVARADGTVSAVRPAPMPFPSSSK